MLSIATLFKNSTEDNPYSFTNYKNKIDDNVKSKSGKKGPEIKNGTIKDSKKGKVYFFNFFEFFLVKNILF